MALEDMSEGEREQAEKLFRFVKANPDIEKNIRREAKRKNPNMSAPDLELEDALTKQREEFNEELKKRDNESLAAIQASRRQEAHARQVLTRMQSRR